MNASLEHGEHNPVRSLTTYVLINTTDNEERTTVVK